MLGVGSRSSTSNKNDSSSASLSSPSPSHHPSHAGIAQARPTSILLGRTSLDSRRPPVTGSAAASESISLALLGQLEHSWQRPGARSRTSVTLWRLSAIQEWRWPSPQEASMFGMWYPALAGTDEFKVVMAPTKAPGIKSPLTRKSTPGVTYAILVRSECWWEIAECSVNIQSWLRINILLRGHGLIITAGAQMRGPQSTHGLMRARTFSRTRTR